MKWTASQIADARIGKPRVQRDLSAPTVARQPNTRADDLFLFAAPPQPPEEAQLASTPRTKAPPPLVRGVDGLFSSPEAEALHQRNNDYTLLLGYVQALEGSLRREGNSGVADRVQAAIDKGTRKGAAV